MMVNTWKKLVEQNCKPIFFALQILKQRLDVDLRGEVNAIKT